MPPNERKILRLYQRFLITLGIFLFFNRILLFFVSFIDEIHFHSKLFSKLIGGSAACSNQMLDKFSRNFKLDTLLWFRKCTKTQIKFLYKIMFDDPICSRVSDLLYLFDRLLNVRADASNNDDVLAKFDGHGTIIGLEPFTKKRLTLVGAKKQDD